ncbi:hypothetical protein VFPFJ_08739 [Purpureocillium lilacinum]|uniref:Uncharacterized protein n=1 Tax=Purpureocillium lilacinum TaxID=33203 RepID=A0A179GAI2_PURLI|nr:hypothetical protein VFPFJ_08739 [Purpureocillium lilacinum]OAQ74826.1 hypothetical protein VFPBJ_10121 [Purpureocillium lilacinum]OAQ82936.1 hypothetical protein VFPFJ_08739 [Purpureocillium lilacinum]
MSRRADAPRVGLVLTALPHLFTESCPYCEYTASPWPDRVPASLARPLRSQSKSLAGLSLLACPLVKAPPRVAATRLHSQGIRVGPDNRNDSRYYYLQALINVPFRGACRRVIMSALLACVAGRPGSFARSTVRCASEY